MEDGLVDGYAIHREPDVGSIGDARRRAAGVHEAQGIAGTQLCSPTGVVLDDEEADAVTRFDGVDSTRQYELPLRNHTKRLSNVVPGESRASACRLKTILSTGLPQPEVSARRRLRMSGTTASVKRSSLP